LRPTLAILFLKVRMSANILRRHKIVNEMTRYALITLILCLAGASVSAQGNAETNQKVQAERYFRAIYACNPAVIDELAANDIVISYPIFEKIVGAAVIRGRQAAKDFSAHFCTVWSEPRITIDEVYEQGNTVILVWSFRALRTGAAQSGETSSGEEHRWGGITLIRFDASGKIVAEIGEESEPGPIGRLNGVTKQEAPEPLSR
jgi:hypothetical protein